MPLSNASRLADFGTGIGTAGAIIQVDNANQRLGVGTTAPTATLGVAGIVSATAFYGDGSNLDGVASAGLGTALSEVEFDPLTVIYQTSDTLSVGATITVDPPDATTKVAYTQYAEIKLEDDADLIVADGDDFIPDILGLSTEGFSFSNANGNGIFDTVYTDNIERADGRGAPNFPLGITVTGISTLSGNVSIGGTLTYEDVTNVDSIGIVTARNGIDITGGNLNAASNLILKVDGGEKVRITSAGNLGINDNNPANQLVVKAPGGSGHCAAKVLSGDASTALFLQSIQGSEGRLGVESNHPLALYAGTAERLRIGTAGQLGINGANYGTSGQVLTSGGASAVVQWATPAGGGMVPLVSYDGTVNALTHDVTTTHLTSTYKKYVLDLWMENGAVGSANQVRLQQYDSGVLRTSSYQSAWGMMQNGQSSFSYNSHSGQDAMIMCRGDLNYFQGKIEFWKPTDNTHETFFQCTGQAQRSSGPANSRILFSNCQGMYDAATEITGIRLLCGGVNILKLYYTLYGCASA